MNMISNTIQPFKRRYTRCFLALLGTAVHLHIHALYLISQLYGNAMCNLSRYESTASADVHIKFPE